MMGNPTKFNDMESGMASSRPTPLSVEEVNRLVNSRSLRDPELVELVNRKEHPTEIPPETPTLPMV
jgi:hypothetical protein